MPGYLRMLARVFKFYIRQKFVCRCLDCIAHSVHIFTVASSGALINLFVKPLRRLPLKRSHHHYDNVTTLGHQTNVCANWS